MYVLVYTYVHTYVRTYVRTYSMARNNRDGLALGSSPLLHSFAFGAGGVQKGLLGAPLRLLGAPLRLLGSFSRAHKEALFRTREAPSLCLLVSPLTPILRFLALHAY